MKSNLALKTLAFVLAVCALVAAVGGAAGILCMSQLGLYDSSVEMLQEQRLSSAAERVAESVVREYIKNNLANMDENWEVYGSYFNDGNDYYWYDFNDQLGPNGWTYTISDEEGSVLESGGGTTVSGTYKNPSKVYQSFAYVVSLGYPHLIACVDSGEPGMEYNSYDVNDDGIPEETIASTIWPVEPTFATAPEQYDEHCRWYNEETGTYFDYYFDWRVSPTYLVEISLPEGFTTSDYSAAYWNLLILMQQNQSILPVCLLAGILVFLTAMVYLGWAAGRKTGSDEIRPGGLNRIPLDLYTAAAVAGVILLAMLIVWVMEAVAYYSTTIHWGLLILAVLAAVAAGVLTVGYLFALIAQLKTRGFWWKNSLIGRCAGAIGRGIRKLARRTGRMVELMPCIWQWAVVGGGLCVLLFLTGLGMSLAPGFAGFLLFMMELIALALVVAYGAYAFGVILEGARRMAQGDLNVKISTRFLFGCFADCANQLNALADVAVEAAKNQLKSDRMKTELITNVSHDIKTPLTSIINYVDLLQKPHTPEEGEQYLAVLARQSQQMKKLIEDLMEMSKAATGNMAVDIAAMDAVEAVNQALGEFSDKLAAVPLTAVVRSPESPVMIWGDGRLVWRTLSNLLQNAVKYSLPGTRLYVQIARAGGSVVISLKNISREELNISAEELMERFVRGDTSRNTEGSGLGLNIAKSLMELQRGRLELLVDGDLFKVSLTFPAAE